MIKKSKPTPFSRCSNQLRLLPLLILLAVASILNSDCAWAEGKSPKPIQSFFDLEARSLNGKNVHFTDYQGKTILVVNIAIGCGTTPQLKDLEKLYEQYKEQGLVIIGFPSTDFGDSAPDSYKEIQTICQKQFGVTFPLFETCKLLGLNKHPVYEYLTKKGPREIRGEVAFNFEKFLVAPNGKVVARYGSFTNALSQRIKKDLESILKTGKIQE